MIILLSVAAMCLCLLVQIVSGTQAVRYFTAPSRRLLTSRPVFTMYVRLCVVMILLKVGTVLQIVIWALLYLLLDTFGSFEEALYFSGVTFTSLGYGDLLLKPPIRLLAPLEAANGLTMFAVVTVILIGALRRYMPRDDQDPTRTKEGQP
jgi:hypothetical protein